jgi:hypothetical protein
MTKDGAARETKAKARAWWEVEKLLKRGLQRPPIGRGGG